MCILTRALSVYIGRPNYDMAYMATHNRIDALSFGVFLGYLYHFRPQILDRLLQPAANRIAITLASAGLLSTAYFISAQQPVLFHLWVHVHLSGVRGSSLALSIRTWAAAFGRRRPGGAIGQRVRVLRNVFRIPFICGKDKLSLGSLA